MHKYMRAVGFAGLSDRKSQQKLITDVIINPTNRRYTSYGQDEFLSEFDKDFAPGIGVGVCGIFDSEENFSYDFERFFHILKILLFLLSAKMRC